VRVWFLSLILLTPLTATAQTYVVRSGDTFGEIADSHGIAIEELARINGVDHPDHIEPGQTIRLSGSEGELTKRGVQHVVRRGVTLSHIAKAYGVSKRRLVRANRLRNRDVLREGMRILVPGAQRVVPIATAPRRPFVADPTEIYRVRTGETRQIVLTRCNGSAWTEGVAQMSTFLDRTGAKSPPQLNRRLIVLLQRVAKRYPDRRIEIVSAYRAPGGEQRASSRHSQARALDFRVKGVANARLRDLVRTFSNVGVGYYPNSTFIHMDVRDRRAFWVDWSGPGEPARYGTLQRDPATKSQPRAQGRARKRSKSPNGRGHASPARGTSAAP